MRMYLEEEWLRIANNILRIIYKHKKMGVSPTDMKKLTGFSNESIYVGIGFSLPYIRRHPKNPFCWTIKEDDVKMIEKYLKKRNLI